MNFFEKPTSFFKRKKNPQNWDSAKWESYKTMGHSHRMAPPKGEHKLLGYENGEAARWVEYGSTWEVSDTFPPFSLSSVSWLNSRGGECHRKYDRVELT